MTRQVKVIETIRQMILSQELKGGTHLKEQDLAERLQVSRTPVRVALATLTQSGLVDSISKKGYFVREITLQDLQDMVLVRSTMEGVIARLAAKKGINDMQSKSLLECLHRGNDILNMGDAETIINAFSKMNMTFHTTIEQIAQSPVLLQATSAYSMVPFRAASLLMALDTDTLITEITYSQRQHEDIYQTLLNRDSARAESLMREHAMIPLRHLEILRMKSPNTNEKPLYTVFDSGFTFAHKK